jgi:hypothetical protein
MIMAQLAKSYKGDTYAFQAIADRLEGKPKQTLDGEFDNHIQIEIID